MNDYWENNYRNMVTENDTLTARIEVLEKAQETALGYATRFLEHFVNEHCSPVPDWKPLPDLLGVLTQIDNSTTVARDYNARIEALEAALRRCQTVLGNMAAENEGAIFNRWPINHEPLRNDARHLLPVIDAALAPEQEK